MTMLLSPHKFQTEFLVTPEQIFEFSFAGYIIPVLQSLGEELQRDDYIQLLINASCRAMRQVAQEAAHGASGSDFASFKACMLKNWSSYMADHILTYEVVENSDEALELRVTECLRAQHFRAHGAAHIGFATLVEPDFTWTRGFNPRVRMIRTKCLMLRDECCNHRWVWEE